jgi:hypothetical protein
MHFNVELTPQAQQMKSDMFILMSANVAKLPSDGTDPYLLANLVDQIMVRLAGSIVFMLKDCHDA